MHVYRFAFHPHALPLVFMSDVDHPQNVKGAENIVAGAFQRAGFKIKNACKDVTTWHYHCFERNWTNYLSGKHLRGHEGLVFEMHRQGLEVFIFTINNIMIDYSTIIVSFQLTSTQQSNREKMKLLSKISRCAFPLRVDYEVADEDEFTDLGRLKVSLPPPKTKEQYDIINSRQSGHGVGKKEQARSNDSKQAGERRIYISPFLVFFFGFIITVATISFVYEASNSWDFSTQPDVRASR